MPPPPSPQHPPPLYLPRVISTVEKVLFLKGVDLFKTIPGEELSYLAQITEEVEYTPNQLIFKEGDQGDAMYLIVDGKVKVHVGERQLAELGQKQCVGEMSILDAEPRSASVTSVTESTLLKIQREDFTEILAEKPEISQGIIKVLTRRLREANRR
jgi:CRP/FNR family transcriptional regulator, cyclic AMP receptor protein